MSDLVRAALRAVNSDVPLAVGEWFDAVYACHSRLDALGETDHAIRRVAALAPLIALDEPARPSVLGSLVSDATSADEIHQVLGLLTHVTAHPQNHTRARLLAQAEKELLTPSPIPQELDNALSEWMAVISRRPFNAQTALQVASFQYRLLGHGEELLTQVVDVDGASLARTADAVSAARAQWLTVRDRLVQQTANTVDTPRQDLALAQFHLSKALKAESDPASRLAALTRTDFGGNLAAAQALHTAQPHPDLLAASHSLIDMEDHLSRDGIRAVAAPGVRSHAALAEGIQITSTTPASMPEPTRVVAAGGVVDPDLVLTRENEIELARRRDVGVLAEAALQGDPQARRIVASHGTSTDELEQLQADGETAVSQMVVAVIPVLRRMHAVHADRADEDAVQTATIRMLSAARSWDPNHKTETRWLSMAFQVAERTRVEAVQERTKGQLVTVPLGLEAGGRWIATSVTHRPDTIAVEGAVGADMLRRVHAVIDEMALEDPEVGAAISLRLGVGGKQPKTATAIAAQLQVSDSAALRMVNQGLLTLREALRPDPALEEIAELPAETRKLMIERYGLEGGPRKSIKELAQERGCSQAVVRSRLLRGFRELSEPAEHPAASNPRLPLPTEADLTELPPNLARVVAARFGLDDGTPKTFQGISKIVGLTPSTAWKHFHQAMYYLEREDPRVRQARSATIQDIQATLDRLTRDQPERHADRGNHPPPPEPKPNRDRELS